MENPGSLDSRFRGNDTGKSGDDNKNAHSKFIKITLHFQFFALDFLLCKINL